MSWKPKYFIVYPYKSVEDLQWECTTHYRCMGHIPNMLQELLGVSTVGGEIKCIWNHQHEMQIVKRFDITHQQLKDYIKADCCMISFTSIRTRSKALEHLKRLGAKEMCLADSYREMMLLQAHYKEYKSFPKDAQVV